ncbi:PKD domain-containing protein [candidate division KSB1 bacterium]|nr:PKD domain-containing protein [candidate division KSB1 bacterium]
MNRSIFIVLSVFLTIHCKKDAPTEPKTPTGTETYIDLRASAGETALSAKFFAVVKNFKEPLSFDWNFADTSYNTQTSEITEMTFPQNGQYTVYVTASNSDGYITDSLTFVLPFSKVVVDPELKYQTIDGFGAFGAMDVWWSNGPFYTENFIDLVVNDLGLSIHRNNIPWDFEPTNDNTDPYKIDTNNFNIKGTIAKQLPYLKALRKAGVDKFIISCWTPMDWMKIDIPKDVEPHCNGQCGGKLNPILYQEYAEYLVAFIQMLKRECGIELYAISPQNEPLFEQTTFESCVYTPEELADVIKILGSRIDQADLQTKIFAPEHMGSFSWEQGFFNALLRNDDITRTYTDIFAVHSYLDGVTPDYGDAAGWRQMYQECAKYQKPLWMSETSGYEQTWTGAQKLAESIYVALKYGKISAWIYWQLSESGPSEYALMRDGQPTPLYYVSKHFYRYIRPGAEQFESASDDEKILVLTFNNENDVSNTFIYINRDRKPRSILLDGISEAGAEYTIYRSTRDLNCQQAGTTVATNAVLLPGESITTLYSKEK